MAGDAREPVWVSNTDLELGILHGGIATYDIRTAYDDRGRNLVVALRDRAGSA